MSFPLLFRRAQLFWGGSQQLHGGRRWPLSVCFQGCAMGEAAIAATERLELYVFQNCFCFFLLSTSGINFVIKTFSGSVPWVPIHLLPPCIQRTSWWDMHQLQCLHIHTLQCHVNNDQLKLRHPLKLKIKLISSSQRSGNQMCILP